VVLLKFRLGCLLQLSLQVHYNRINRFVVSSYACVLYLRIILYPMYIASDIVRGTIELLFADVSARRHAKVYSFFVCMFVHLCSLYIVCIL